MADGPLSNASPYTPENLIRRQIEAQQAQIAALQQQGAPRGGGILSNADPVMLSLAAGLLSPTKTGGFGESLGLGLQAAQGPLSEIRQQETARADKLGALQNAQAKLAMDLFEIQTGGRRGYKPEDPSLLATRWQNLKTSAMQEMDNLDPNDPNYEANRDKLTKRINYLDGLIDSVSGLSEKEPAKAEAKKDSPPEGYPDAKKGFDGGWYVPDPARPGKFLKVE